MHEFGICRSILREVLHAATENGSRKVRRIRVRIGPLAALSATELRATMPLVSQGSLAENAEIITETPPLRVRCNDCNRETETELSQLRCGACDHSNVRPVNGDELLLVGIELAQ